MHYMRPRANRNRRMHQGLKAINKLKTNTYPLSDGKSRLGPNSRAVLVEYKAVGPKKVATQRASVHAYNSNNTHGKGAITAVKPAKSAVAPTVPSREYI